MSGTPDARIPLTVVTGFLGSGKTTLIRRLLADARFARAAVIVNEYGEAGIAHHLFRKTEDRITLLRDGCACCARRDDLVEALQDLVRRLDRGDTPFDRVLLETSGLADPAPILHTIVADPLLSRRYRRERVISTLDAVAGIANLETYPEAVRQITAADSIVITKRDLASHDGEARLLDLASALNPAAAIIRADHGRFDVSHLTCEPGARGSRMAARSDPAPDALLHRRPGGVSSLTVTFDTPFDWPMLGVWLTMLLHCHGSRMLRVKGLLDVGDDGPLLLEGVQHVIHAPRHLPAWPDANRQSTIVFIVRDLEPRHVRESLAAFQQLAADSP